MVSKIVVSVVVILPAIIVVFVAGALRGVEMEPTQWIFSGVLLLVSLLPMVLLGLALDLWFKQAAVALSILVLAMLGGLWFPLSMMPEAMAAIGRLSFTGREKSVSGSPWRGTFRDVGFG